MTAPTAAAPEPSALYAAAELRQRYEAVFRAMLKLALASYASYLILFAALGVPQMPVVNAAATGLVLLSMFVLARGHRGIALLLIATVVLGHAVPATVVLGWDAGFHLFAYLFLIFLALHPELGLRLKVGIFLAMLAGYLALERFSHGRSVLVPLTTQAVFEQLNIVMFWCSLAFLALIYSRAIWRATESLHAANARLESAQRSFRDAFQLSPVAMVLSHRSTQELLHANRRAEELFEVSLKEVLGKPVQSFWVRPENRDAFRGAIARDGRVEGLETELRTQRGREFWGELSGCFLEYQGQPALLVTCADVTERRRLAALTEESERTLRTLLDAAPTPLVVTGLDDGVIRYSNRRAAELFELPLEQLVGRRAPDFYVVPEDRRAFIDQLRRDGHVAAFTARLKSSSGREVWMVLSARTLVLREEHLFMVGFADVTAHKALETRLRELASTDPLTGAANRRTFQDAATLELERAGRYGHATSIALVDADHFKKINDGFGHSAGDQALRSLVAAIRGQIRSSDVLARYGGEEFALLLPETPLDVARQVAERVRAAVEARGFEADGARRGLTVSVGVCAARKGEDLEDAVRRADRALYDAKQSGRNRVVASEA